VQMGAELREAGATDPFATMLGESGIRSHSLATRIHNVK
jgi:hypothetical protein